MADETKPEESEMPRAEEQEGEDLTDTQDGGVIKVQ